MVNIVIPGFEDTPEYAVGARTSDVKEDLRLTIGKGFLWRNGVVDISQNLSDGDYEWRITSKEKESSKTQEKTYSVDEITTMFAKIRAEDKNEVISSLRIAVSHYKEGTSVLVKQLTQSLVANLQRYKDAKSLNETLTNRIEWPAPWADYFKWRIPLLPETSKNSEPTVQRPNIEIELNCVQNIFNVEFIKKKKVNAPTGREDRLYFTFLEIGVWTFKDTHKNDLWGTTQDCIMILRDREATPCSVGLLIELVGQGLSSFPDSDHCSKIVRDLIKMHSKRSFLGHLYSVVTDLTQLIILKIEGPEDNLVVSRSNLKSGLEVQIVMEKFAAATAEELGIDFRFREEHTFKSVRAGRPGRYCVNLDGILGAGKQSTVFKVAMCPGAFVKQFQLKQERDAEQTHLVKLADVTGVCQILGVEDAAPAGPYSILCGLVGRKLVTLSEYGNMFLTCELGCQLVSIIKDVHSKKILHRDISLHNVFVVMSDSNYPTQVFLSDFGCAVPRGSSVVYQGTANTAANVVLEVIEENRQALLQFNEAMDLESIVKTLWMVLSPESQVITKRNGNKSAFGDILAGWQALEHCGMFSTILREWLVAARSGDHDELHKILCFRDQFDEPPHSAVKRFWKSTADVVKKVVNPLLKATKTGSTILEKEAALLRDYTPTKIQRAVISWDVLPMLSTDLAVGKRKRLSISEESDESRPSDERSLSEVKAQINAISRFQPRTIEDKPHRQYPMVFDKWKVLDTLGDGNCFLYSLIDQIRLTNPALMSSIVNKGQVLSGLRQRACDAIDAVAQELTNSGSLEFHFQDHIELGTFSVEDLKECMVKNYVYFGPLSIMAIGRALSVTILIWRLKEEGLFVYSKFEVQKPVAVANIYYDGKDHFETMHSNSCACSVCSSGAKVAVNEDGSSKHI